MKLFAGKKITDALVEGVVLGDEVLSLPSHTLTRGGISRISVFGDPSLVRRFASPDP